MKDSKSACAPYACTHGRSQCKKIRRKKRLRSPSFPVLRDESIHLLYKKLLTINFTFTRILIRRHALIEDTEPKGSQQYSGAINSMHRTSLQTCLQTLLSLFPKGANPSIQISRRFLDIADMEGQ